MNDSYSLEDLLDLTACPWCGSEEQTRWGNPVRGFCTVQCAKCSLIYVKNRLSEGGLRKYYQQYLSRVHRFDDELNEKRGDMYSLEFDFVSDFVTPGSVLDVGCSGGYFLDKFKSYGYRTFGVEFGEEAAAQAAQKHKVWLGSFPDLDINTKFDLVIFRGVIEHVGDPKAYLAKAVSLLTEQGCIFITSTPNAAAFCCSLYKDKWNQHEPEAHLFHFNANHFDEYFAKRGLRKKASRTFYEETPYANPENDILKVADALTKRRNGKQIDDVSPPFWGNMMSVIYQRSGK